MSFKIGDTVRIRTASDRPDCYGVILRSAGIGAFAVYWFYNGQVSEYCADYQLVKVKSA